jgi:hypothetical protein
MQEQINLFCAIRRYVGPDVRITSRMFRHATRSISYSAALKRSVWVLTKVQYAQVKEHVPDSALVDPSTIDIPPSMNVDEWVFVDQCIPRERLGIGVAQFEISLKEKLVDDTRPSENGNGDSPVRLQMGGASSHGGNAAVTARVPPSPPSPPQGALRVLEREMSGERDLETSLENMARKIREAFDEGQFVCTDRMNPHSALYWLSEFVTYVEAAEWAAGEEPVVATLFVRYVVKRLLGAKCFEDLHHFTTLLQRLQEKAPRLVPDSTTALVSLAQKGSLDVAEIPWGNMPLGARTTFVESTLYQEFLTLRAENHYEQVREGKNLSAQDCSMDPQYTCVESLSDMCFMSRSLHGARCSTGQGRRHRGQCESLKDGAVPH